jgi:hypothetical protein
MIGRGTFAEVSYKVAVKKLWIFMSFRTERRGVKNLGGFNREILAALRMTKR